LTLDPVLAGHGLTVTRDRAGERLIFARIERDRQSVDRDACERKTGQVLRWSADRARNLAVPAAYQIDLEPQIPTWDLHRPLPMV
jgi:hypothetical protein